MVLVDLPGITKPFDRLTERMQRAVDETLTDADAVVLMLNGQEGVGPGDRYIAARVLRDGSVPCLIAINKTDRMRPHAIAETISAAAELGPFHSMHPISALRGDGVDALRDDLVSLLEPGPAYFPEGVISDQTDEARVGEAVREAALEALRDEIPHAVAVRIEEIVPGRRGVTVVRATIICETDSQKRIVVGAGGSKVKEIGTVARPQVESIVGGPVFLELSVTGTSCRAARSTRRHRGTRGRRWLARARAEGHPPPAACASAAGGGSALPFYPVLTRSWRSVARLADRLQEAGAASERAADRLDPDRVRTRPQQQAPPAVAGIVPCDVRVPDGTLAAGLLGVGGHPGGDEHPHTVVEDPEAIASAEGIHHAQPYGRTAAEPEGAFLVETALRAELEGRPDTEAKPRITPAARRCTRLMYMTSPMHVSVDGRKGNPAGHSQDRDRRHHGCKKPLGEHFRPPFGRRGRVSQPGHTRARPHSYASQVGPRSAATGPAGPRASCARRCAAPFSASGTQR